MLDGAPATDEATRPLAALLSAATAPAHPDELSGERVALAAFDEAAQLAPVPSPRRTNVLKSTLAKILTVKVAVVAAAAAGATGVVLASTSGVLAPGDGPADHGPADQPPAVHSSAHTPAGTPRNGDNGDSDSDKGAGKSGEAPSPSMAGLCNAYTAHKTDNPGKALDNPAFSALITAAGGKENVDEYCETVANDAGQADDTHGKPADAPDNDNAGEGGDNGDAGSDHGNDDGADGGEDGDDDSGNGNAPATRPAAPQTPTR
jgi:hypothetical protein